MSSYLHHPAGIGIIPIPAFAFPFSEQTYKDASYVTYDYDNSGALATVYDSETGISTTYYYGFTDRMMKYVEEGTGYSHSVGYEYDAINNLTSMVETINGVKHTTGYTYDKDNRVTAITTDGISESYTYDAYGRVSTKVTKNGSATILTETYTYVTNSAGQPTGQVATHRTRGTGYDVTYSYTYDGNGNILSVSDGTYTTTYQYDSANQLIRENNQQAGKTWTWSYDNAGNIQSDIEFPYTIGELDSSGYDNEYIYGDSQWGDLLTEHVRKITYDSIGNVICDNSDNVFTWKNGRQLISYKEDGNEAEDIFHYEYNADGLRAKAYNGYTSYRYVYNGSSLVQLEIFSFDTGAVTDTLYFTYDTVGTPQTVKHNGTVYYYVTNLQGDVTAILDSTGTVVVSYTYDAWGNHTSGHSGTGTLTSTLGRYNPLRYRGYIYDVPSELYYLQSRYYNPSLGRFISPDALVSTGQGVLGNNMFSYCGNNPINSRDSTGQISETAIAVIACAIVGGIVNAICAFSTGGSLEDVALAFVTGLLEGALSQWNQVAKCGVIIWNTVETIIDCYSNGADIGSSLLAGAVNLISSIPYIPNCDILTDCLVDMTFGLGASMVSAGVTQSIKSSHRTTKATSNGSPKLSGSGFKKNFHQTSTSDSISTPDPQPWTPGYTGFGQIYPEYYFKKGFCVPSIPNPYRTI